MADKPTVLFLSFNGEPGGYHMLLAQRRPKRGEQGMQTVESQSFAPGDIAGALKAVLGRMEQHRISLVTINDPGKRLLKVKTTTDLKANQVRAFLTTVARS